MQTKSDTSNKEKVWVSIKVVAKVVMAGDMVTDVKGNFIRRPAQNVKRNAKFLSNQAVIGRSTARIAILKGRIAAADFSSIFGGRSGI